MEINPQDQNTKLLETSHLNKLKILTEIAINNCNSFKSLELDENEYVEQEFKGIFNKIKAIIGQNNYDRIIGNRQIEETKATDTPSDKNKKVEQLYNNLTQLLQNKQQVDDALAQLGTELNQMLNIKCIVEPQKQKEGNVSEYVKEIQNIAKGISKWKYVENEKNLITIKHPNPFANGDLVEPKYTGETLNGKANGLGMIEYVQGKDPKQPLSFKAYGTFKENQLHGILHVIYGSGWKDMIEYSHNIKNGLFRNYQGNNLLRGQSLCVNDSIDGYGIRFNADGSIQYQGDFSDSRWDGQGCVWFEDRSTFEGKFKMFRQSEGIYTDAKGNKWMRKFDADMDRENRIHYNMQKPITENKIN